VIPPAPLFETYPIGFLPFPWLPWYLSFLRHIFCGPDTLSRYPYLGLISLDSPFLPDRCDTYHLSPFFSVVPPTLPDTLIFHIYHFLPLFSPPDMIPLTCNFFSADPPAHFFLCENGHHLCLWNQYLDFQKPPCLWKNWSMSTKTNLSRLKNQG